MSSLFRTPTGGGDKSPVRNREDDKSPVRNREDDKSPVRNREDDKSPVRNREDDKSPVRNREDIESMVVQNACVNRQYRIPPFGKPISRLLALR
jgi:hypothetical protein